MEPLHWNPGNAGAARARLLTARFTAEEAERLVALRQRLGAELPDLDDTLDDRRLVFARWLVEHGRLREDL